MDKKDAIKARLTEYVESITQKSKKGAYICPICGSGTGKNLSGAFNIDPNDPTIWHCFSGKHEGERSGDIFDLIGYMEKLPKFPDQLKRAGEIFGIDTEDTYTHQHIHTEAYTQADTHKESLLPYFRECQKHLKETTYHTERGISDETARRFMLGYDSHYKADKRIWKALIIPIGEYNYNARIINPDGKIDKYRKPAGGNIPLFNIKALETAETPIFITEGEIDALSIIEAGGEAIALSGSSMYRKLTAIVKEQKPAQPLILALDNDEAGQKATEQLASALDDLGVIYYRADPAELYSGRKDANEALKEDREALAQAVEEAEEQARQLAAEQEAQQLEEEEAQREAYYKTSALYHIDAFRDGIKASADTPPQPTGFETLDDEDHLDGGLYEGLYIIGAVTSLGKTTLALQIADQIAESGRDVLIFSLEMSRTELMSKSISRLTATQIMRAGGDMRNAKTNRGITDGRRYEHYSEAEKTLISSAISEYERRYSAHIFIHEGIGNIGAEYIRKTIESHIFFTGQAPVVLIDYIQILAPYDVRATDKQNTDKTVLELKRISREFKIPVIGISSLNRDNYRAGSNGKITLEAFKESGAIEYGADVVLGLQFSGAGKSGFDLEAVMKQEPRAIELVIMKNRNGKRGDKITYAYYPKFNYFTEA